MEDCTIHYVATQKLEAAILSAIQRISWYVRDVYKRQVFKHTSDVFDLSADELQFTEINGRELAVFHYTN